MSDAVGTKRCCYVMISHTDHIAVVEQSLLRSAVNIFDGVISVSIYRENMYRVCIENIYRVF